MPNKIEQHIREVQNSSRPVRYMRPVVISRIGGVWKISTKDAVHSGVIPGMNGSSVALSVAQSVVVSKERGF